MLAYINDKVHSSLIFLTFLYEFLYTMGVNVVLQMALLRGVYWMCILLSSVLPFFHIGIFIVPFILMFMLGLTVGSIPISIAWGEETYGNMLLQCIVNVIFAIFIYSIFYVKSGLIIGGELVSVDLSTAIYFSGTTWTTVGYGDLSAPESIRLLTTIEAINGYLAMAILMALVVLWLDDALKQARHYKNWLRNAFQEDIEEATGINLSELLDKNKKS